MATPKYKQRYQKIKDGHKIMIKSSGHGKTRKKFLKEARKALKDLIKMMDNEC